MWKGWNGLPGGWIGVDCQLLYPIAGQIARREMHLSGVSKVEIAGQREQLDFLGAFYQPKVSRASCGFDLEQQAAEVARRWGKTVDGQGQVVFMLAEPLRQILERDHLPV